MKNELAIELSNELKKFLTEKPSLDFSAFAKAKVFTSAYLHMTNSLAIFISSNSFSENEPEEIIDLWGLSFCKIFDYEKLYKKDSKFLEGLSKKQKESIDSELDNKKNIVDISVFILLDKSGPEAINSKAEDDLTKQLAKTHHQISWKKYTLWWNLDHSHTEVPANLKAPDPFVSAKLVKMPKNWTSIPFFDPHIYEFKPNCVASNLDEIDFTYTRHLIQIPTLYYKKSQKINSGSTRVNEIPDSRNFQKRKLARLTENVLICGTTGIPLVENEKGTQLLCNPNANRYELMLGAKFCTKMEEMPRRKKTWLKGTWMAVHLQNNVVSHFFFEVLKKVLYAARVVKFGLLITGVKPAPHILEFFTVDSELKDRITEIKICDPDFIYKPEKSILAFESAREFRPEDLLNFQRFGESIISRSNNKESFGDKIYISRKDSPGSRIIINENYLITRLEKNGFKILRFDQLSLVQKLVAIKNAKDIVTGAGSGYLFRNLVATNNIVRIITSDSYIWNDYSLCALGVGVRNEIFIIFEKEQSLASNFFPTCRNHASIQISRDFFKNPKDVDWGEKNVRWIFVEGKLVRLTI